MFVKCPCIELADSVLLADVIHLIHVLQVDWNAVDCCEFRNVAFSAVVFQHCRSCGNCGVARTYIFPSLVTEHGSLTM